VSRCGRAVFHGKSDPAGRLDPRVHGRPDTTILERSPRSPCYWYRSSVRLCRVDRARRSAGVDQVGGELYSDAVSSDDGIVPVTQPELTSRNRLQSSTGRSICSR